MILVTFQVCSNPSVAEKPSPPTGASSPVNQTANQTVEQPAFQVSNGSTQTSIPPQQPLYGDSSGGGVQSYGGALDQYRSSLGAPLADSRLVRDSSNLAFITAYGVYSFNATNPAVMSYLKSDGMVLSPSSYFSLQSLDKNTIPSGGQIELASNDALVVNYDLVTSSPDSQMMGRMKLYVNFAGSMIPKMTATVLWVDPSFSNWHIVWQTAPGVDMQFLQMGKSNYHWRVSNFLGETVPFSDRSVNLFDSKSSICLNVDWTDAAEGTLSVAHSHAFASGVLQVSFAKGRAIVDPKLVSTTTGTETVGLTCQRTTFSYAGFYWAFYNRGSTISYNYSADGLAWSTGLDLPEGTAILPGTGFDVAQSDNHVIVAWYQNEAAAHLWMKIGTISKNTITWGAKKVLWQGRLPGAPAVAIGTDGAYWVAAQVDRFSGNNTPFFNVSRSFDGISFTRIMVRGTVNNAARSWYVLLPVAGGKMWLVDTWYSGNPSWDTQSGVSKFDGFSWGPRILSGVSPNWIAMTDGAKYAAFSALAGPGQIIHMAYKASNSSSGWLCYAYFDPVALKWYSSIVDTSTISSPSISLDANLHLHIFYAVSQYWVCHVEKTANILVSFGDYVSWGNPQMVFAKQIGAISYVTSWSHPSAYCAVLWQESSTPVRIYSATLPLPVGTYGIGGQPWNRDGLSPYGKYFSDVGMSVSPGTGLLTYTTDLISIPCRSGVDLSVSLIYQEPRYFSPITYDPYAYYAFPYCDIGWYDGWSLDLPWTNGNVVALSGGQNYVVQWGNTGDPMLFENHVGTHFTLKQHFGGLHSGVWYELLTASGLRYDFSTSLYISNFGPSMGLTNITDLRTDSSLNPATSGLSIVNFAYSGNRLAAITEMQGMHRRVTFNYSSTSYLLSDITNPDNKKFYFYYADYGLSAVKDPMNRITYFGYMYDAATNSVVLNKTVFPSGSKVVYTYAQFSPSGADVVSWIVKSEAIRDNRTNALIRQTDFFYNTVAGCVVFANLTEKDETGKVQRSTEYTFSSRNNYLRETVKDRSGIQLSREDTWYDQVGQPFRTDEYNGSSQDISFSTYTAYDDWGNVIFTRNALKNEAYFSYANSKANNSFQGGGLANKLTSGLIFYDSFDDWNYSDWSCSKSGAAIITLDAPTDPQNAPYFVLHRGDSPSTCVASHAITAQASDFVMQLSWWTSSMERCYILGKSGATSRLNFSCSGGSFQYWNAKVWTSVGSSYAYRVWYDIGFVVHYSAKTYDIFINGMLVKSGAPLIGSGAFDSIRIQEGDQTQGASTVYVDSIRLYRSVTVTVALLSGYVAELYDTNGTLLNRSKQGGVLNFPLLSTRSPPGSVRIFKPGYSAFAIPVVDVWGGDLYSMGAGTVQTGMPKNATGYGAAFSGSNGAIADDSWPSTTLYTSGNGNEGAWISDSTNGAYAVSGTKYHVSSFTPGSHYHGFTNSSTTMTVSPTNVLIQYIWLDAIPKEIMVEFQFGDGTLRRAFWGGSGTGVDSLTTAKNPWLTPTTLKRFRVGDVPTVTGKWYQLTVKASDLGLTATSSVKGVIYGLYDGKAKWDFTSCFNSGLYVYLGSHWRDWEAVLVLDNGATAYANTPSDSASPAIIDLYSVARNLPASGRLRLVDWNNTVLYESPWIPEIYNLDRYTYSTPESYCDPVRLDIHDAIVGSLIYQDFGKTIQERTYYKRNYEGDVLETRSPFGSTWVRTQSGYDKYGNMIWSTDPSGRRIITDYGTSDGYTYPADIREGGQNDTFDLDASWTPSKTSSTGDTSWLSAGYSSGQTYSPPSSLGLSFTGSTSQRRTGVAKMWKNYQSGNIQSISLRMFVQTYTQSGSGDSLDSGIKMRLFDSEGYNYATYTYWLATWPWMTTTDPNTKNLGNNWAIGTWSSQTMCPLTDFAIDWTGCANVSFEIYENIVSNQWFPSDAFSVFYDDFTIDSYLSGKVAFTYDRSGNVLTTRDPLGRWTNNTYDSLGRAIKTTNPDGTYCNCTYYDSRNMVVIWDELRRKSANWYDKIGRLNKTERYGLDYVNYSYETFTYNWQDQIASYKNALQRVTLYSYDCLGRLIKTTYPGGSYSTVSYDDLNGRVTKTDELGHKTTQVFSNMKQLNVTREYYTASAYYETRMAYDAIGNLLTVKDANGRITRMTYDSLNRLTKITYPDGLFESATYDSSGKVLSTTSRSGVISTHSYDTAGKLVSLSDYEGTTHYSYDAAGQVVQAANSLGIITYSYNKRGWVTCLTQKINGDSFTARFGFDAVGNNLWTLYPDLTNVTRTYDDFNRLSYMIRKGTGPGSVLLLDVAYNVDDTIATEQYGWSQVTTYTYDQTYKRGWVRSMVTMNGTNTLLSLTYTYDAVGNIKYIVSGSGGNESYRYDFLNRLTRALTNTSGSWGTITYGYDAVGNRIWKNEAGVNTTYTYSGYNQLNKTTAGTAVWFYNYDRNGNQIWKNKSADTRYNYQFNTLDQLSNAVKWTYNSGTKTWSSATVGQYWYDANGARAMTTEGSATSEYVYLGHDPLCEKNGTVYTDYAYANGQLKARLVGGSTYFYFGDIIGSTWLVWKSGQTVATFSVKTYKPFGTPIISTGTEKFGYAGEIRDSATGSAPGLYYIGARWMDPELGRWLSLDPYLGSLSYPQTLNRYVYCANNPLKIVDPTGRYYVRTSNPWGGLKLPKEFQFLAEDCSGDPRMLAGELILAAAVIVWENREGIWSWFKQGVAFDVELGLKFGAWALKTAVGITMFVRGLMYEVKGIADRMIKRGEAFIHESIEYLKGELREMRDRLVRTSLAIANEIRRTVNEIVGAAKNLFEQGIATGKAILEVGEDLVKGVIQEGTNLVVKTVVGVYEGLKRLLPTLGGPIKPITVPILNIKISF